MSHTDARRPRRGALGGCALLACLLLSAPALAQPQVTLGGNAFIDYYYLLSSPDEGAEGQNGFEFRRFRLTADSKLSDAFSLRARLEATESTLGEKGSVPFVKDFFLTWKVGGGHDLIIGLSRPPAYAPAESIWGYRALEKSPVDLYSVVSSRDMGVRATGPLLADNTLRYDVMVGNNNSVFPEDDKHKRVYGQLGYYPTEQLVFTLSSNYASFEAPREGRYAFAALAGYRAARWRAGVEGFHDTQTFDGPDDLATAGLSVHGTVDLLETLSLTGRVDRVRAETFADDLVATRHSTLGILGLDFRPHPDVHFIPNVEVIAVDGAGTANALGRLTLWVDF